MPKETPRRRVSLDFEALIEAFKDRDYDQSLFLDLEKGEILSVLESDFNEEDRHPVAAEIDSHPDRYLGIPNLEPDDRLEDLAAFVREEGAEDLVVRVREALSAGLGGGDIQELFAGEPSLAEEWASYLHARMKARLVEWLSSKGVEAVDAEVAQA